MELLLEWSGGWSGLQLGLQLESSWSWDSWLCVFSSLRVFDVLVDSCFDFAFVRYPGLVHRPRIISVAYIPFTPDDQSSIQFVAFARS
jgi:hypothetical protein